MAETREWFRAIPVPKSEDKALQQTLEAIKENVETLAGVRGRGEWKPGNFKWNNTALTMGDLIDSDFLSSLASLETSIVNVDPGEVPWGEAPPAPTNLHVIIHSDSNLTSPWYHHLEWDNPEDLSNVYFIEVWSSTIDNISTASRIGIVTPPNNSIIVYGLNLSSDYYYWIRSISYGYKHSVWEPSPDQGGYLVEGRGTVDDIIDTLMAILKGETPPAWDSSLTYYIGDTVSLTDGTITRRYQCILQHTNQTPPNTTYWERIGILMEGEVDGIGIVGIDGNLVVDGTIISRHIAANTIEGTHIKAAEIVVAHIASAAESAILNSLQDWSDIQNPPTSLQSIFYQATEPVSGMVTGDWWMDTDDERFYRYSGSAWIETQDVDIVTAITNAATAQSTADGKIVTFIQTTQPTAEAEGDLWFDSDDDYKMYRWDGDSWDLVRDSGIAYAINAAAGAQATADGKVVTFYQSGTPTAEGVGDLWVETDQNNRLRRWTGSTWEIVDNTDIAQAISDAASAQSTADGKITTFYQASIPTGDEGDIWFDTDDDNRPYIADSDNSNEIKSGEWELALPHAFGGSISGTASASTGGLYLGSDKMGFYSGTVWKTYMDSDGNFYLGGTGGVLQWDGSTLSIEGNLAGGKSSFSDSTAGFWIGDDSGTYKLNIGDGDYYLSWNGSELIVAGTLGGVTAGDYIEVGADIANLVIPMTYTKTKEIVVGRNGTWRVGFDLKQNNFGDAHARIYKNGSPYGTERVTNSTSWQSYSQDLSFVAGDLCQLYAHGNSGIATGAAVVRNFRMNCAVPIVCGIELD